MKLIIAILPGDGIGPEIINEAKKVLDRIGEKYDAPFVYEDMLMGGCSIDKYGVPLTDETIETAKSCDAVLMGSIGGNTSTSPWYKLPPEKRPEAGLLGIRKALGLSDKDSMILVFGGSLGAETINRETLGLIDEVASSGVKLYFVTGRRYYDRIKEAVDAKDSEFSKSDSLKLIPYTDEMPKLMCASDVVVSRSGAIAVSEIAACGKPCILIPSPNVTDNHQYYNAKALADAGAALLLEEKDLPEGGGILAKEVLGLLSAPERLREMSEKSGKLGRTNAADLIVDNLDLRE